MFDFSYLEQDATLVCRFGGKMDSAASAQAAKAFEQRLKDLAEKGPEPSRPLARVVFDLEKADYISSVFLRIIMIGIKRVRLGNFAIINASPFVLDLLKTTGLDKAARIECAQKKSPVFPPPPSFAATARINSMADYERLYRESIDNPDRFWGEQARSQLIWQEPWSRVCDWDPPVVKWFEGGKLNASVNCLDRHLGTPVEQKTALIWEGEPEGAEHRRTLSYRELHDQVCRFANVLKHQGIGKGDRVLIYLPMVPEAVISMLACARLGAIHSVVFGGFSSQSIAERVADCRAKVIVTADGGYRRGAIVPMKANVDGALDLVDGNGKRLCESVQRVIVLRRTGHEVRMMAGRDVWWDEQIRGASPVCAPELCLSEDVLFILYTSGSTGRPKGIFHTTAGYLLGAKLTHLYLFDNKDNDIYWCTADVGWITGHSYIVYGPLANGATVLIYEGAPNHPEPDRFWRIVERYRVTTLYTAPTAIRSFMKWGDEWPKKHDLSSLRLLGTVGEPINPEAWMWYNELIGGGRCPIVDTWWQTETGSCMIAALPGAVPAKPGSAALPFFGVLPEIVDEGGTPVPRETGGKLIIRRPWPSMLRGVWGDPDRYQWVYWSEVPGSYYTGDGARQDQDGYYWIMGRIDDVLNVSGHRIGTAEVESVLVGHHAVAEAATVGRPDDLKGMVVVAFVTLKSGVTPSESLKEELRRRVAEEIGPHAKPDEIRFAEALPKTRSGKIMRRILKQIAGGMEVRGDMTTLEDYSVLARLGAEESESQRR